MKTTDYQPRLEWDARLQLPLGSIERIVHNRTTWIAAQTGLLAPADYWRAIQIELHLSDDDIGQLADDFYSGDTLDADLIAVIRAYRAAGHPVALLSNDSPELLDKLHRLHIADLFDPLVISAQIGVMKPDARAYRAVLDRLNYPPAETVFIDDRLDNVIGARALGIHTIHYQAGVNLAPLLEKLLYT